MNESKYCYITVRSTSEYIMLGYTNAICVAIENVDVALENFATELKLLKIKETPVFYYGYLCVLLDRTSTNAKDIMKRLRKYYVDKITTIAGKAESITADDTAMIMSLANHIELSHDELMRVINGVEI